MTIRQGSINDILTSLTLARLLSAILDIVCTKYCELQDVASSGAETTSLTVRVIQIQLQLCLMGT